MVITIVSLAIKDDYAHGLGSKTILKVMFVITKLQIQTPG